MSRGDIYKVTTMDASDICANTMVDCGITVFTVGLEGQERLWVSLGSHG